MVYNKRNKVVEESPHVIFDESDVDLNKDKDANQISGQLTGAQEKDSTTTSTSQDGKDEEEEQGLEPSEEPTANEDLPPARIFLKDHPESNVIGNVNDDMKTRSALRQLIHEDLIILFS